MNEICTAMQSFQFPVASLHSIIFSALKAVNGKKKKNDFFT